MKPSGLGKIFGKVLFVFCVVFILFCSAPPFSAFGADKLVVKDSEGVNTKFVVTDEGKVGIGTASPAAVLETAGAMTGPFPAAALIDTTLSSGQDNDLLYGLKIEPVINANGYLNPVLYGLGVLGDNNGQVRFRFSNSNSGTAAQTGMEFANDAGQALFSIYGSNYAATTLQNVFYVKNGIGGMKFVGFTGSSIGFGIGTTAGSATGLVVSSSNNVGISTEFPTQKLEVNGGVRLNTVTARPTCDANARGTFWVEQDTTNDVVQVCAMTGGSLMWTTLQRL